MRRLMTEVSSEMEICDNLWISQFQLAIGTRFPAYMSIIQITNFWVIGLLIKLGQHGLLYWDDFLANTFFSLEAM